ncbi:hypothetical protein [Actinacidiphila glaucinigra]|uniref:hypothetical protein n=1 Tax=Actinacidiphila glaucinigra TaxID=235986 RepID=UPI003723BCBE
MPVRARNASLRNTVTWAIRVAVFVVPVVAFAVTKRIRPGLQRRDRDMLLHGAETGLIRRLPHGGYVQVHRPLDAARRHVLGSHEQYRPLDPAPAEDADGLPRERTRRERLRLRLPHALYGPASQVAGPTEERCGTASGGDLGTGRGGRGGAGRGGERGTLKPRRRVCPGSA